MIFLRFSNFHIWQATQEEILGLNENYILKNVQSSIEVIKDFVVDSKMPIPT